MNYAQDPDPIEAETTMRRNWERAIAALLETCSVRDAAQRSGFSENTMFRLLRDPEFSKLYRDARRQVVGQTISRLQNLTTEAANTMQECLRCDNPSVRLRASQLIMQQALHGMEVTELDLRVQVIETNLGITPK